jgi:hypothetical protein
MRLWSIHPRYLDRQGLVALWRESLLAQSCLLKGKTIECESCNGTGVSGPGAKFGIECDKCKGTGKIKTPYYNHSQLKRFKEVSSPIFSICNYLWAIYHEGFRRGYKFDVNKIKVPFITIPYIMKVTRGQLIYEFNHLQDKLAKRDLKKYMQNKFQTDNLKDIRANLKNIESHPLFTVVHGEVEEWEKIK